MYLRERCVPEDFQTQFKLWLVVGRSQEVGCVGSLVPSVSGRARRFSSPRAASFLALPAVLLGRTDPGSGLHWAGHLPEKVTMPTWTGALFQVPPSILFLPVAAPTTTPAACSPLHIGLFSVSLLPDHTCPLPGGGVNLEHPLHKDLLSECLKSKQINLRHLLLPQHHQC